MDWGMLGAVGGLLAIQTALILWMMSKLDSDIKSVTADLKAIAKEAREDIKSINKKSDALAVAINARIDTTQGIIMRMLEKQGK